MPLFVTIVLDGVGIGAQPDAALYGEDFCDTLGHVLEQARPNLPHLQALGLGNIKPLPNLSPAENPLASWGKMQERSTGMDSTTGHWELAGLDVEQGFPTYPQGFPDALLEAFRSAAGVQGVINGGVASGTEVIQRLGDQHLETGFPILYTSADSVFQIAAHTEAIPLKRQYELGNLARQEVCVGEHAVGRVICRPFTGTSGAYTRLSDKRKDFSRMPHGPVIQHVLQQHNIRTVGIGKVGDLFGGLGFDASHKTSNNQEGIELTLAQMRAFGRAGGDAFLWTNLVDFDQEYGHRNNVEGFARALEQFDAYLPEFLALLPRGGRLCITADHGNDPSTPSTDHNREFVPVLLYGAEPRDLGTRPTFADHAATVAAFFNVPFPLKGASPML